MEDIKLIKERTYGVLPEKDEYSESGFIAKQIIDEKLSDVKDLVELTHSWLHSGEEVFSLMGPNNKPSLHFDFGGPAFVVYTNLHDIDLDGKGIDPDTYRVLKTRDDEGAVFMSGALDRFVTVLKESSGK